MHFAVFQHRLQLISVYHAHKAAAHHIQAAAPIGYVQHLGAGQVKAGIRLRVLYSHQIELWLQACILTVHSYKSDLTAVVPNGNIGHKAIGQAVFHLIPAGLGDHLNIAAFIRRLSGVDHLAVVRHIGAQQAGLALNLIQILTTVIQPQLGAALIVCNQIRVRSGGNRIGITVYSGEFLLAV